MRKDYREDREGKEERSRSRSGEKNRRHKDNRDRWQHDKSNYQQDRRDNRSRDWKRKNQQEDNDRSYNRQNQHNRNYNRSNQKQKPIVNIVEVEAPKTFVLSQSSIFSGNFRVNIVRSQQQPVRVEKSLLGELKNKITPIERLWSSHIKQYLNISQFVQIYRHNKSLAYAPTEYGKTVIQYQQDWNCIVYNNLIEQSQIFSRAYFKLWEILETGVLDDMKNKEMSIGCVAEGPGGFIHALVDYRLRQQKTQTKIQKDTYNAITLKIDSSTRNAKDWSDQRGYRLFKRLREIGQSINLSYGKTGTGDLLLRENIEYFQSEVKRKCQLVTGDGGIECIGDKQFEYQQIFNSKLFLGEIITALHIQEENGKFILKIYDIGFEITRQLIMLLALYYHQVKIIKPITSRPGNSEKYLLCEGFKGIKEEELQQLKEVLRQWTVIQPNLTYFQNKQFVHSLFDFSHIPNHEVIYHNIKEANDWFVNQQIQKIQEGLKLSEKHKESARSIQEELKQTRWTEQISFAYCWCKKYGLPTIEVSIDSKE